MGKAQQQTEIPGTEQVDNPEVREALNAWISAKADQKDAAETTKLRHTVLLGRMAEAKLDRFTYVDHEGKRRVLVVDREPKAKTKAAPAERKKKPTKAQQAAQERAEEKREEAAAETAGARVDAADAALSAFTGATGQPAHSDPFGRARRAIEGRE